MPTLSLRAKRGGEGVPDRGREPAGRTAAAGRSDEGESVGPSPAGTDSGGGDGREGRIDPLPGSASAPTRDVTPDGDRSGAPPSGRDPAVRYPGFTFKTLAPRIDVTDREPPDRRDVTYRDAGGGHRDRPTTSTDIEDLLSGADLDRSKYPSDLDGLIEKLHRDIERKRRIERERRGL